MPRQLTEKMKRLDINYYVIINRVMDFLDKLSLVMHPEFTIMILKVKGYQWSFIRQPVYENLRLDRLHRRPY